MIRIERWARSTQIPALLSYLDRLPRFVHIPLPVLLGSNNDSEILIEGDLTTSMIRKELANLDEPFNPNLRFQKTVGGKKRETPSRFMALIHQHLQKGFAKVCLLDRTGECGQKVIRAHSLQKAVFKNHAKRGHVYEFDAFGGSRDLDQRLWPDLVGINEATTFTGFCEHHDSRVFSAIDNAPFQNTAEQIFLHHYRAFAQAYYGRAYRFRPIESAFMELTKTSPNVELSSMAAGVRINQHNVQELAGLKSMYEQQLQSRDWSAVEGYAFIGEGMPEILGAELFGPHKDFQGHHIQDCKARAPINWISMTITASGGDALFVLCGRRGCPLLQQIVSSFRKIPRASKTTALMTYVFCQFENFIILPAWWDVLPKEAQLKFVDVFQGRYYPRETPNRCDWKLKEIGSKD